jgi:hypothetical protein
VAVLCAEYDVLFAHLPRTGGRFVEGVLLEHLDGRLVGNRHDTFRRLGLRRMPTVRVFTVREALPWYRSYWAFARQVARKRSAWPTWDDGSGTHPTTELDRTCGYPDFERFVRTALERFPNGFVRSLHCDFLNGATHVLRSSHLAEDLETLLRLVSFEHPSLVRQRPPVHEGASQLKDRAVLPEEIAERVRQVDNFDGLAFPLVAG